MKTVPLNNAIKFERCSHIAKLKQNCILFMYVRGTDSHLEHTGGFDGEERAACFA